MKRFGDIKLQDLCKSSRICSMKHKKKYTHFCRIQELQRNSFAFQIGTNSTRCTCDKLNTFWRILDSEKPISYLCTLVLRVSYFVNSNDNRRHESFIVGVGIIFLEGLRIYNIDPYPEEK